MKLMEVVERKLCEEVLVQMYLKQFLNGVLSVKVVLRIFRLVAEVVEVTTVGSTTIMFLLVFTFCVIGGGGGVVIGGGGGSSYSAGSSTIYYEGVGIDGSLAITYQCAPTQSPTTAPTYLPSVTPTVIPSPAPSTIPTFLPTALPTKLPTILPTIFPSITPTTVPTVQPTVKPSLAPTVVPIFQPTTPPTAEPTSFETKTFAFTGKVQNMTLAGCVNMIQVEVAGARGGDVAGYPDPGLGAKVYDIIALPGVVELLYIYVGGIGADVEGTIGGGRGGFNGGGNPSRFFGTGGGGASDSKFQHLRLTAFLM